jgi:hypothetical protein
LNTLWSRNKGLLIESDANDPNLRLGYWWLEPPKIWTFKSHISIENSKDSDRWLQRGIKRFVQVALGVSSKFLSVGLQDVEW